jgi:uncharacterized protein with HEPN domain
MPLPELNKPDTVRLRHMLDAARQAIGFTAGRERSSLDSDVMFRRAVVNCIQEIGEAAVRVSPEARSFIRRCRGARLSRCGIAWYMRILT